MELFKQNYRVLERGWGADGRILSRVWQDLGTSSRDWVRPAHGPSQGIVRPLSHNFICPKCGELWGKVETLGPANPGWYPGPWCNHTRECRECGGDSFSLYGSLGTATDPEVLMQAPDGVLRRELELVLKLYQPGEPSPFVIQEEIKANDNSTSTSDTNPNEAGCPLTSYHAREPAEAGQPNTERRGVVRFEYINNPGVHFEYVNKRS